MDNMIPHRQTPIPDLRPLRRTNIAFITEFKRDSSGELSFLRRVAALALLEALCAITERDPATLFAAPQVDLPLLIVQHRTHPLIVIFMLSHQINPLQDTWSASDNDTIRCCLMQLSQHWG